MVLFTMTVIEAERRSRGWSQSVLGYHACIAQSDLSKVERRRVVLRPSQALRLSRVLGVPIDALLREVRDPREAGEAAHA